MIPAFTATMNPTLLTIAADIDVDFVPNPTQRCLFVDCLTEIKPYTDGLFSIYSFESLTFKVYQPRAYSLANATYTQGVDAALLTYRADADNTDKTVHSILTWLSEIHERSNHLFIILIGYHTTAQINPELSEELKQLCQRYGVTFYGVVKVDVATQEVTGRDELLNFIKRSI